MAGASNQLGFETGALPPRLVDDIRLQNPWWSGGALPPLPSFRRWPFDILLKRLLRTPPLARINVMRGPRQIGKTTLQYQLIEHLLEQGVDPRRILRVQFDELPSFRVAAQGEPILEIIEWFAHKIHGKDLNASARAGQPALLFFDEVQNLAEWAVQLKSLVDRTDVRMLVTGSSALRIELGRDSLAGRIQPLEIGPFRLSEIAALRNLGNLPPFAKQNGSGDWGLPEFWHDLAAHGRKHGEVRDRAFEAFSERGGYPLAQRADIGWPEVATQLNEVVIQRVIQHDLRVGERGRRRDPQLLEEMFRMAARYCGQAPSLTTLAREAQEALAANVGVNRIRAYIEFLNSSLLLRAIGPHEMRLKKRRGPPKLCLSDHALRAAWLGEIVPLHEEGLELAPTLQDLAGRIAESTAGYFLASLGLPISYLPERASESEIDFVLTAGDHRIPIEVKYQRSIDPVRDTKGPSRFIEKKVNRAPLGVIVTRSDSEVRLPNKIAAIPLKSLLLAH